MILYFFIASQARHVSVNGKDFVIKGVIFFSNKRIVIYEIYIFNIFLFAFVSGTGQGKGCC